MVEMSWERESITATAPIRAQNATVSTMDVSYETCYNGYEKRVSVFSTASDLVPTASPKQFVEEEEEEELIPPPLYGHRFPKLVFRKSLTYKRPVKKPFKSFFVVVVGRRGDFSRN